MQNISKQSNFKKAIIVANDDKASKDKKLLRKNASENRNPLAFKKRLQ